MPCTCEPCKLTLLLILTSRESMTQRLLHVGASASSIIHTYISTIKALSIIEKISGRQSVEWV